MKSKAGKIALVVVALFVGSALITGIFQGISDHINGVTPETDPPSRAVSADAEDADQAIYTLSDSEPDPTPEPEQTPETDAPAVEEPEEEAEPEVLTLSEPEEPAAPVTRETPDPLFPEYEREQTVEYVLNTSSRKIHKPTCNDVKKIKPENYSTTTDMDSYLSQGYTKCGHCW